jgi:PAS domain S-box-containing protein
MVHNDRALMNDAAVVGPPARRMALLLGAVALIVGIASVDYSTKPYFSLGFLYLFPIMMVGALQNRVQTVVIALGCAFLQERFSYLPPDEQVVRLVFSSAGFVGTGLFVSEVVRNRQMVVRHVAELEEQVRRRKDAEEELHSLIDTSPAAILTIDAAGDIVLANDAARRLLVPDAPSLEGRNIEAYLPSLHAVVLTHPTRVLRTSLQCRGQRAGGEAFLAAVWFSTYRTLAGPRLAAIVVDVSEDLRNREDLSLDHLLTNARVLMSAVAHEVRNLSGAALVVYKNLSRREDLRDNDDFKALSTLIQSLDSIIALELQPATATTASAVELTPVFDELRVLIGAAFAESGMEVEWHVPEVLPLVWADRYALFHVFLNLAKNSQRAMASAPQPRLRVSATAEGRRVTIRFEDTGPGIDSPADLFRPFRSHAGSSGLGLYVSRALVRSFQGDLAYEPRDRGACFAVVLAVTAGSGQGAA